MVPVPDHQPGQAPAGAPAVTPEVARRLAARLAPHLVAMRAILAGTQFETNTSVSPATTIFIAGTLARDPV